MLTQSEDAFEATEDEVFDAERLRLVYRERISWHDAKLQEYRLPPDVQSLLSRSEVHKIHIWQHLLFG